MTFITKSTGRGTNGLSLVPIPKVPNAYYECACSRLYYIDMNYETNILTTWKIESSDITTNDLIFLTNDGNFEVVSYAEHGISGNQELNSLIGQSANYFNRFLVGNSNPLISIGYVDSVKDIIFMNTNRADYFVYYSRTSANVVGRECLEGETADDMSSISNYYQDSGYSAFNDFNDESAMYGNYELNINYSYCVFDYTNLKYNNEGDKTFNVRGENLTFYTTAIELVGAPDNFNYLEISYGAPYYSIGQSEYTRGYGNGFSGGYVQGKEDGYIQGFNANTNHETATAFDYIGQAFGAVSNILELQVLPNITLGLCFSIPLVITLIMVIFKMVKK